MEILDEWRAKVAQVPPDAGLALADQMLGLQGQVELPALQRAYAEVLLELLARSNESVANGPPNDLPAFLATSRRRSCANAMERLWPRPWKLNLNPPRPAP